MRKILKKIIVLSLCQFLLFGAAWGNLGGLHTLEATSNDNIVKETNPLGKEERDSYQTFQSDNKYVYIYSKAHKRDVLINTFIDNRKFGGIQDWVGIYGYDNSWPPTGPIPQPYPGHAGIDVTLSHGSTIYAVVGGTVSVYYNNGSAGNEVRVTNGIYVYRYLHLSSISVSNGQSISAGQSLGAEGKTGGNYGTHLHFEVQKNGTPIDPYNILQGKDDSNVIVSGRYYFYLNQDGTLNYADEKNESGTIIKKKNISLESNMVTM